MTLGEITSKQNKQLFLGALVQNITKATSEQQHRKETTQRKG